MRFTLSPSWPPPSDWAKYPSTSPTPNGFMSSSSCFRTSLPGCIPSVPSSPCLSTPSSGPTWRATGLHGKVRRGGKTFYLVCGFGYTGRMIVSGLLKRGISAAILEREESIIHSLSLIDEFAHLTGPGRRCNRPPLARHGGTGDDIKNCAGVIAITNDDHANLTIAITSKLLRPDLPVLARSETRRVVANMASFGTDLTVDPLHDFRRTLLPRAVFSHQVPGSGLADQRARHRAAGGIIPS